MMKLLGFVLVLTIIGSAFSACPTGQIEGCNNNCNSKCSDFNRGGTPNPALCPNPVCLPQNRACECNRAAGWYYSNSKKTCVKSSECKQNP